jgi:hypothetical protein
LDLLVFKKKIFVHLFWPGVEQDMIVLAVTLPAIHMEVDLRASVGRLDPTSADPQEGTF